MPDLPPTADFDHGICAVDTHYLRPGLAASHLIVENGRVAIVDTGANSAVPRLLAALEHKELDPDSVDYLFLTHVHLDHAGGAGLLMRSLPRAVALLHPRGAPHMIDPARLIAGSRAVYGEQKYAELYGEIVPIAADRVREVADGEHIDLGGRMLECMHTEGHARHHYCIADPIASAVFSGDSFGISYRGLDTAAGPFILPTTTPVQFDPDAAHAAIERILGTGAESVYLTHYSRVQNLVPLAQQLHSDLDFYVAAAEKVAAADDREDRLSAALTDYYRDRIAAHGTADPQAALDMLRMDIKLNVQGLLVWLKRRGAF
jgi:glyoxylase-like metal-dependent hydrolase (beta-lactamase superfamily II)